jgi:phosphorylcholine metabolism protein LicD
MGPKRITSDSSEIKKCHNELFRMLKFIAKVCEKHNISYWICGGTLLGAIYYKGFKPTSHDIDIAVPNDDFSRLQSVLKFVSTDGFFVEEVKSDLLKLVSTNAGYIHTYASNRDHKGIFLDIFFTKILIHENEVQYGSQMGSDEFFSTSVLFPLQNYKFEGEFFPGPAKGREFLEQFDRTKTMLEEFITNKAYYDTLQKKYVNGEEISEADFMSI